MRTLILALALVGVHAPAALAATYEVGPGKPHATIGSVPWATLGPGDTVLIHWKSTPYREKWVLGRQGTAAAPIVVRGVKGPNGERPVIDGSGAVTPSNLSYWSGQRGVIKIGGSNNPPDTMPMHIVIESLDLRSARAAYSYRASNGATTAYAGNASAIYVEKGQNITIRDCWMHDCGNGFFANNGAANVVVERCRIWDNGNVGSIYEHNNYTESNGIVFQFNWFGPLRAGCDGNNLKDRSAGTVVRYNWIEGGNRQLDLVDSHAFAANPRFRTTLVYGNVLVETPGAGNSQVIHYGGDSGNTSEYRKGTLHLYNNTIVSRRTDRTVLVRLSSSGESADCRNNVIYTAGSGGSLALSDSAGTLDLRSNWIKTGYVASHGSLSGQVRDLGGNRTGSSPGFVNEAAANYRLAAGSPAIDASTAILTGLLPAHDVTMEYVEHQGTKQRSRVGVLDLGAFEHGAGAAGIAVTPASASFGSVTVGSSATRTITLTNNGGSVLTGTASTTAPFSIVSGGSYSLGAGQSVTVTVRFAPTVPGTVSGAVAFTGASGARANITGTGVARPPSPSPSPSPSPFPSPSPSPSPRPSPTPAPGGTTAPGSTAPNPGDSSGGAGCAVRPPSSGGTSPATLSGWLVGILVLLWRRFLGRTP